MKILLNESEVRGIISCLSLEDIKQYSGGEYKKWDVSCADSGDGLEIEYIFTDKGDLKPKFKEKEE